MQKDGEGRSLLGMDYFSQQLSPTGTVPVTTPQYFAVHRSYSIIFSAIRILKLLIS